MISKDSIIADIIDAIETQFIGVDNDVKSYYASIFIRRLSSILDIISQDDHKLLDNTINPLRSPTTTTIKHKLALLTSTPNDLIASYHIRRKSTTIACDMNDGSNVKHSMPSMPDDTECLIDMSLDKHTSKLTEDCTRRQSSEEIKSRSRSREKPGLRLTPDRCLADIDCMQPLSISIKADDRLACIPEKELRYVDVDERTFIQSGYQHMAICCKQEYADKQLRVYSLENDLMISGIIVNLKFYDKFGVWALVYEETYSKRLRLKFFRSNNLNSRNGILYEDYLSCKTINAYCHVFLCSSERGIQGFDLNTINNMFHESLQLKLISTSASIFISNDIADFCIHGQHLYTIDKACKTVSRVNMSFKSRNPLSNRNSS